MKRVLLSFGLATMAFTATSCAAQAGATEADAIAAWRSGRYEQAIAGLASAATRPEASWTVRRAHVLALLEVAKFDEAAAAASTYADRFPEDSALAGEVAATRGDISTALSAYRAALASGTADSVRVLALTGSALARQGRWEEAGAADARAIRAGESTRDPEALIALSGAHVRNGRSDPQEFRVALALLDDALEAEPGHPGANAALSDLFLSKYNAPDARRAALAALEVNPRHPGALLAEARRRRFETQGGVDSLTRLALEVAPASVRARAFAGLLRLDAEDREGARDEAELALSVDPTDLESLAVLAASYLISGDEGSLADVEARALRSESAAGRFYAILGEQGARLRRYKRAAELGSEGARLDPLEFRAHAVAGINLLRLGEVTAARTALERAFEGDPYDVWTKNTLDLLDSYELFEERREGRVVVFLEREEADLVAPYMHWLVGAAIDSLSRRYAYEPDGEIRMELYRRPADFSVRTVGLAGMGALGVSFGDVLAMNSPAARRPGEFNYGATAWHEVAHTYTLGLSDGKVPRWLSEGISVYEERRSRPGWGARPDPATLAAFSSGDMPPPSNLGEAFASPGTAVRLGQAYILASLVAEYIADEFGEQALPSLVAAFADGATQEEAMLRAPGLTAGELDTGFREWMRDRYPAFFAGDPASAVRRMAADVRQGTELLESGNARDALAPLQRAMEMIPDYGGTDAPRALLARAQLALGDTTQALQLFEQHSRLAESDLASNLVVAGIHEARGDTASAVEALDRAVWLSTYETALHQRLAAAARSAGRHDIVVRERRAVVALRPADRAGAHYELALALKDAGEPAAARSEVLRALDLAPNFVLAQELLLELRSASTPERRQ